MLNPSWEKRKQLLADALEMPEAERHTFLLAAAAGDSELHNDLVSLLKYAVEPDERFDAALDFADSWPADEPSDEPARIAHASAPGSQDAAETQSSSLTSPGSQAAGWLRPGTIVGHYKIIRLIGSGGMGDVFEAEQDRPRRPVALKVLRTGPMDRISQRRFEFEAELLGRLDHPGIAQVYEAGAFQLDDGSSHPFLAMELVHGVPLVEFADSKNLDTPDRLKLLIRVCEAVEHAHQRRVIHRDLKPANILVGNAGPTGAQPKLLDFGIARIVDSGTAEDTDNPRTQFTRAGDVLGTVQYMSPEQLAGDGLKITTRTDVYALGMLAYRLLTGEYPFGRISSVMVAAEAIRTRKPTTPSAHNPKLRGDLDTILLKAIERDPSHRYASAADLAAEFSRVLNDEPIHARSASAAYRARKFVKRNKGGVAAASSVLLAMIVGTAVSAWQAVETTRARHVATSQAEELLKVVRGLLATDSLLFRHSGTLDERRALLSYLLPMMESLQTQKIRDPQLKMDLAYLVFKIGHAQGSPNGANAGDVDGAEKLLGRALAMVDDVLRSHAPTGDWITLRHDICRTLGIVLASRPGTGEIGYGIMCEQVALARRLAEEFPAQTQYRKLFALGSAEAIRIGELISRSFGCQAYRNWFCGIRVDPALEENLSIKTRSDLVFRAASIQIQYDREAALPEMQRAEKLLDEAIRQNPGDMDIELTRADVDRYRAKHAEHHDWKTSAELHALAAQRYRAIAKEYDANFVAQDTECLSEIAAARAALHAGLPDAAWQAAARGTRVSIDLFRRDPVNARWAILGRECLRWAAVAEVTLAEGSDRGSPARVAHAGEALALGELIQYWNEQSPSDESGLSESEDDGPRIEQVRERAASVLRAGH